MQNIEIKLIFYKNVTLYEHCFLQGAKTGGEDLYSVSQTQETAKVPTYLAERCKASLQTSDQPSGGQGGQDTRLREQG